MSHFYRQKSYSFYETDELLKEVKNEMSNFLTKEEAELILNKRYAMIDPNPNQEQKNHMIIEEIHILRNMFFELNQKIHDALVEMSGNESLMMIHSMLSKRMRSLRYSGNSTPDNWRGALEDHEEIATALGKRDMKAIKKAVNDHFANTIQRVVKKS